MGALSFQAAVRVSFFGPFRKSVWVIQKGFRSRAALRARFPSGGIRRSPHVSRLRVYFIFGLLITDVFVYSTCLAVGCIVVLETIKDIIF